MRRSSSATTRGMAAVMRGEQEAVERQGDEGQGVEDPAGAVERDRGAHSTPASPSRTRLLHSEDALALPAVDQGADEGPDER